MTPAVQWYVPLQWVVSCYLERPTSKLTEVNLLKKHFLRAKCSWLEVGVFFYESQMYHCMTFYNRTRLSYWERERARAANVSLKKGIPAFTTVDTTPTGLLSNGITFGPDSAAWQHYILSENITFCQKTLHKTLICLKTLHYICWHVVR